MKKLLAILLVICMIPYGMVAFADEYPEVDVMINGELLETDQPAIIYQDRTLVPLRAICEALGCDVTWEAETRTAVIENDYAVVTVVIDSKTIEKLIHEDGASEKIEIDVPAMIMNDRTLVPLRAVSEAFEAEVTWDGEKKSVFITKELPKADDADVESLLGELLGIDSKSNFVNGAPRYNFEQKVLPAYVFENSDSIHGQIMKKDKALEKTVDDIWYDNLIYEIFGDDVAPFMEDRSMVSYVSSEYGMIKLTADEHFSTSYETLDDGSVMLLIEFNNTDGMVLCKHIGITAVKDGGVRYFTSETDVFTKDNMFFCEIVPSARGTLAFIGFEKEDFIKAANAAISSGTGLADKTTDVVGGVVTPEGYISKKYGIGMVVTTGISVIDPEVVKAEIADPELTAMVAMGENMALHVAVSENALSEQSFNEYYETIIDNIKAEKTMKITGEETDLIAGKESKIVTGTASIDGEDDFFRFCYIKSGECVVVLSFTYNADGEKDVDAILERVYAISE